MRSSSPATPNALGRDIQNVVSDAQELLKTVQTEGESKLADIKGKASAQLETAKQKYGEIQQTVQDGAKLAINETDQYVHSNPWTAIGIGAAVGVVIGYLCGRAGNGH
jgi:ElaB/YqjD/DUF883 family membrane-anchored ribosome-binding protein